MYVFDTLKIGSKGAEVRFLQRSLPTWAWEQPSYSELDGAFGPVTRDAILRFQKENDLPENGKADRTTCMVLGIWADIVPGIDVSDHQGVIDWANVVGPDFVFIKASQGDTFRAKRWADNYTGARGAGLKVGAYHYADADTSAHTEVVNFLKALDDRPLDLPVALDVEGKFALEGDAATAWVHAWLEEVEMELGVQPILYTSSRIVRLKKLGESITKYRVWHPRYGDQPANVLPWDNWSIWQYSSSGQVPGIKARVDMNHMVATDF